MDDFLCFFATSEVATLKNVLDT